MFSINSKMAQRPNSNQDTAPVTIFRIFRFRTHGRCVTAPDMRAIPAFSDLHFDLVSKWSAPV